MGPYEEVVVNLQMMEQYSKWFKKINPIGKLPAMKVKREGKPDFDMFESGAMMIYLCRSRGFDDHWYPHNDALMQAKLDMYLHWHHGNIRMGAGGYMFRKYFSGLMDKNGVWSTDVAVKEAWKLIEDSLKQIQKVWLKPDRGHKYMFGEKPSICDLLLACELTNLGAINFDLT